MIYYHPNDNSRMGYAAYYGVNGIFASSDWTDYDFADYLYQKNAHGDVTALIDNNGNVNRYYRYDAFGIPGSYSADDTNPFLYAGQYYDRESQSYYLRARSYLPRYGRFSQQDTHWNTGNMLYGDNPVTLNGRQIPNYAAISQGLNLYTYCADNPVKYYDPNGEWIHIAVGAVVGAAISAGINVMHQMRTTGKVDGTKVAIAAVGGALSGALAATGAGIVVQVVGNAAVGAAQGLAEQTYDIQTGAASEYDLLEIGLSACVGGIGGAVGGVADVSGIKSLSNQAIKRIGNAVNYHIGNGSTKEISSALTYYYKSAHTLIYREIIEGLKYAAKVDIAYKIISETELAESAKQELREILCSD